ncbi:TetR/AcrR family transcriptional regulator [Pseudonocardiaceae bacterium YIM PH 21723]|nr:TetR/AcrR family transcriptional regulator [Pseudonocardiaceae bacterium YIM PH 21723]
MRTGVLAQRILDAAEEVFLEHGYRATVAELVAPRAGVSLATLYQQLGEDADIVDQLFHREIQRFIDAIVASCSKPRSLRLWFVDTVVFSVTYLRGNPLAARLRIDDPESGMPWLTRYIPLIAGQLEPLVDMMVKHSRSGEGFAQASARVVTDWAMRLVFSFMTTPSAVDLREPTTLRQHLNVLFDIGMATTRPHSGSAMAKSE